MITIPDREIPYSCIPVSLFIPQRKNVDVKDYMDLVSRIMPIYLSRAVEDPVFGLDMKCDIEEILGGKTEKRRERLSGKDTALLNTLLKTLRSIDYTDRINIPSGDQCPKIPTFPDADENDTKTDSYIYDMEL